MAGLIGNLVEVLKQECALYEEFIQMADNKKEVIIEGDVPSLREITKKEESLAGQLLRLEKERSEIVKDICLVSNIESDGISIREILTKLKLNEADKEELEKIADDFIKKLDIANKANETNRILIESSLDYLDYSINVARSLQGTVMPATYKSKGFDDYENESSAFDKSQ